MLLISVSMQPTQISVNDRDRYIDHTAGHSPSICCMRKR